MKKYIKMMRLDHWIKQLIITPGICFAFLLCGGDKSISVLVPKLILGFIATSLIASANYEINEYLDREFDRFHPIKKNRPAASEEVNGKIVWLFWAILSILGLLLAWIINTLFFFTALWLLVMGILYNVKPIRTKDIPILDVLSESVNNAIRLLLGWFLISPNTIPPSSIVLGYWMAGAFLMATKRFSEYRMIANPKTAGLYRKSFQRYSERSLLISAFFYAMCSVFFVGIFLIKYRIELVLFMPILMGLFCYYFYLSFQKDSAAQRPEKLFREKGLMIYCFILCVIFVLLMIIDIPFLAKLTESELIILK